MNAAAWTLAIDFGTTNTAAAYFRSGAPALKVLTLGSETQTMPSALIVDEAGGQMITGDAAIAQMRLYPSEFRANPKLELGKDSILVGGTHYNTTSIIAAILRHVRERALEENQNVAPAEVILTHPADWGDNRVDALRESAIKAGFAPQTIRMVEEPEAAARHYGNTAGEPAVGERIAVFDFGGGTLDVAIIERTTDGYETVDTDGDETIGGKDFDELLYQWALAQLSEKTGTDMGARLDRPESLALQLTLRDSIRHAKESLSTNETVRIPVYVPGFNNALSITGGEYRAMIKPLVDRAVALTQKLIQTTGGRVDRLYLTGGSSRTPLVRESLQTALKLTPLTRDNLKLVVAEGALYVPRAADMERKRREEEEQLAAAEQLRLAEAERFRLAEEQRQRDGQEQVQQQGNDGVETAEQWQARQDAEERRRREAEGESTTDEEAAKKKRRRVITWASVGGAAAVILLIIVIVRLIPPPPPPPPTPDPDITAADCLSSETFNSVLEECVPDEEEDPPGPADCLSDEEWDADLEQCVTVTSDPVDCWDGSTADTAFDCPAFEGQAALETGFETDGGTCVGVDPSATEGWLGDSVEAITCTWSDLPYTSVNIARYNQNATGYWNGAGTFEGLAVDGETWSDNAGSALGTTWDAASYDVNSNALWNATIFAYEDLPISAEVFTNLADGGDIGANDVAIGRLLYLTGASVDAVVEGLP